MKEYTLADGYYLDEDGMIWDEHSCRYLEEDEKDELFPSYDLIANRVFYEK